MARVPKNMGRQRLNSGPATAFVDVPPKGPKTLVGIGTPYERQCHALPPPPIQV